MQPAGLGRFPGARVLLIGTGHHDPRGGLPDVPSVGPTLADLRQALITRCRIPAEAITVLEDAATPMEMGDAVLEAAHRATDLLLVYYVGHGVLNSGRALHLAAASTAAHGTRVDHTGLPFAVVGKRIRESRATHRIVILDCCFAGRALDGPSGLGEGDTENGGGAGGGTVTRSDGNADTLADQAMDSGGFVLTSASKFTPALAPSGARHTAFTGALLRLLRDGDPGGGPALTLEGVRRYLQRALPEAGLPRPRSRTDDLMGGLAIAANPAYRSGPQYAPQPPGQTAGADPVSPVCPYNGLAAFDVGDERLFHGRGKLTGQMLEELRSRHYDVARPLVVIGASGAGKSSLLRAGLLPALDQGRLRVPGSADWPRLVLTPTADPVGALAAQIATLPETPDRAELAAQLRAEPTDLAALLRPAGQVVLVVDQFEEVFTLCRDRHERQVFLRALLTAAADGDHGTATALVVLSTREDFYGRFASWPELEPLLHDSPVVVAAMSADEVRDAILLPARQAGMTVEPELVGLLLDDLDAGTDTDAGAYEPGRLPLLSHALRATWLQQHNGTMTVSGYRRTGGIRDALAATADAVLDGLDEQDRETTRRLLLRLVAVGDGAEVTRRRVARAELLEGLPAARAERILDDLTGDETRLLTTDHADGGARVQITHEALIRSWPRLRGWIDADRTRLRVHEQLTEAARAWQRQGRETALIYRGSRLSAAQDWAAAQPAPGALSPLEREFLAAGARVARRGVRLRRTLFAALSGLLALSLVAAGIAFAQREHAQDLQRIAVARGLAIQAADLAAHGAPDASLLNAVEAFHQGPDVVQARSAVLSSQSGYFAGRLGGVSSTSFIVDTAISPDGRTVAAGDTDGNTLLWDVRTRRRIADLTDDSGTVYAVTFSPDGRTLATGSEDGFIRLWSTASRTVVGKLAGDDPLPGHMAQPLSKLAFSPDGRTLAATDDVGTATLWDVPKRQVIGTLAGGVEQVAFSPDGRTLATADLAGTVRLWKRDGYDNPLIFTLPGKGSTQHGVAFAPDSRSLATVGDDDLATLWNLSGRRLSSSTFAGHTNSVDTVAFTPDGRTLITSSRSGGGVIEWDVASHREIATPTGDTHGVTAATLSPDGHTLATADDGDVLLWNLDRSLLVTHPLAPVSATALSPDGHTAAIVSDPTSQVTLWDVAGRRVLATLHRHRGIVFGMAFSPDGRTLAVTGAGAPITLYDVATRRATGTLTGRYSDGVGLAVAFSPDGRTLASIGGDVDLKAITLWDLRQHRARTRFTDPSAVVTVVFSRDGHSLATSDQEGQTVVRSLPDYRTTAVFATDHAGVYGVAFAPDGRTLLAAGSNGTATLWDIPRRHVLGTFTGERLTGVMALSPDGHTLATSEADNGIALWDVRTRQVIGMLSGHTADVGSLMFAPDGHTLLSAGADGTARIWETDPARVAAQDCALIGPLDRARWARLAPDLAYRASCP